MSLRWSTWRVLRRYGPTCVITRRRCVGRGLPCGRSRPGASRGVRKGDARAAGMRPVRKSLVVTNRANGAGETGAPEADRRAADKPLAELYATALLDLDGVVYRGTDA